ncbi:fimbrial protein [Moellerella wisconsensis]|uniref:Type 1 fimbrial protein n=1 Tax=Moellerella wisconsensis TaxID=158849 RepID=A0A9Q8V4P6_9GAMM|nr:fimbrial protein [Moellerella wisconsensis]UNH24297.1 type 1 fimbrial protein [Moellerella wisconsensis]UNH27402.1 type 1 fimbrial protein [Moellerella wisconsensis]UNH30876.1 type 1 fimbrial protein [Moellerella wisconsensis]UNH42540.1 type 1 fimbrial protein [Moellerella wisconsensis]WJW82006.1 fimbrial protein [Moellerella wisconsensis]
MKRILYFFISLFLIQYATVTYANVSGDINFIGRITPGECEIDFIGEGGTVKLGDYKASEFPEINSTSPPIDFQIQLINCIGIFKTSLIFNGEAYPTDNNIFSLNKGDEHTEGFGLVIYNGISDNPNTHSPIIPGEENIYTTDSPSVEWSGPKLTLILNFFAYYIRKENMIKQGLAEAAMTIDFEFS